MVTYICNNNMEKDIVLAIQKEEEYIQRKIVGGDNTANLYDYLAKAGYIDINDFNYDKFFYNLTSLNITSVTDSATVLQPMAYNNYLNGISFCYFVEYDKHFALVPMSFSQEDEERFNEYGFDCFKCGYDDGGIILTDPRDFRFCIAFDKPNINRMPSYILNELYSFLLTYYPELTIDENDFMYDGKKVAGCVRFDTPDLSVFAINISIIDMYDYAEELGIIKTKIPGCLPYVEGLKDILKNKVKTWLRH